MFQALIFTLFGIYLIIDGVGSSLIYGVPAVRKALMLFNVQANQKPFEHIPRVIRAIVGIALLVVFS